jgi:hypothetical protein
MPPKYPNRPPDDSPSNAPVAVADVLRKSPIAQILASREAKSNIEPERAMPEPDTDGSEAALAFKRQREREQAVSDPSKVSHAARMHRMQPPPEGFMPVATFAAAGIRVNKSLDRGTAAIQFDEARRPSRQGLVNEVDTLEIEGFRYEPLRRQWERHDRAQPGTNVIMAARLAEGMAAKRTERER